MLFPLREEGQLRNWAGQRLFVPGQAPLWVYFNTVSEVEWGREWSREISPPLSEVESSAGFTS